MKYWADIKDRLTHPIELGLQLLLLLLWIYVFIMADKLSLYKAPLIFIGLLSWFFYRNQTKHPITWLVILTLLLLDLYQFYFRVANHHFMLVFVVLSVVFYKYHKNRGIFLKNIQLLMMVVLVASVIQKLMSPQYMSGNFYYYMMNRGFVFTNFYSFFPESIEITKSNSEAITTLQELDPNSVKIIKLKEAFANLGFMSLFFAWATVVIEFIVAIALLWKPRKTWTHVLFVTMIIGILCTRLETGFMALLAICGVVLCNNIKLRLMYVFIVIGCITLIAAKFGFH